MERYDYKINIRGDRKNWVTYSSYMHDQQDLPWGNTSRDTSVKNGKNRNKWSLMVGWLGSPFGELIII